MPDQIKSTQQKKDSQKEFPQSINKAEENKLENENNVNNSIVNQLEKKKTSLRSSRSTRFIILGIINILLFAGLTIFIIKIGNLPETLEQDSLTEINYDEGVLRSQLAANEERISFIENFIADEQRLVDFVGELDQMKKNGIVDNFSFVSNQKVTDKTSTMGYPIKISVNGDINKITQAIEEIQDLPYLFRPVSFDLSKNSNDNIYILDYGILLYINE